MREAEAWLPFAKRNFIYKGNNQITNKLNHHVPNQTSSKLIWQYLISGVG